MRHSFFTLLLCLSCYLSYSQSENPFMNDANGRPMYMRSEYRVQGSPFLYDDYCMSDITFMNGKVYPGIMTKLDFDQKTLIYKLDNGTELLVTTPIKKVKFYNCVIDGVAYGKRIFQGRNKALNDPTGSIYECIYDDSSASLLKYTSVTYNDSRGYGEATITRTFRKSIVYFAAVPGISDQLKKVDRNKPAIAALFGVNAAAVSKFIEEKKLKCKTDEDLVLVFRYYSTL